MADLQKRTLKQNLAWIYIIFGLIGVFCAFTLSQDKIRLLENPNSALGCSLDPILACGNVISSSQGHAFGFPNPFLGLAGFAAVVTIGVAILAGGRFKRWLWLAIEAGLTFALFFVHWLFYQSVYIIGNRCIYCMAVWIVVITTWWYTTLFNIDQKHISLPARLKKPYAFLRRHHLDILVLWFLAIAALILNHFWYYYGTKF